MAHLNTGGVRLKLARADECLALLRDGRAALLPAAGLRIVGQFEPDKSDYVFRVEGEPPPAEWGVTLGIYVHLLRSALDNVLALLVEAHGGAVTRSHQFPIFERKSDFWANTNEGPRAEAMTRGIESDELAFIESAQPFTAREDNPFLDALRSAMPESGKAALANLYAAWHPLAMLAHLNNVDKHRRLHASYAAAALDVRGYDGKPAPTILASRGHAFLYVLPSEIIRAAWPVPVCRDGSVVDHGEFVVGGSDEDPTQVARIHVTPVPGKPPKMEMNARAAIEVSYSDSERPMTIFDLENIRTAVHELFDRFSPTIDEHPPGIRPPSHGAVLESVFTVRRMSD